MRARVAEIWRYPLKSMLGERIMRAKIGRSGISGDRSFALLDVATGKVCSAKRYDLWGGLFGFRAELDEPGRALVTFPDGVVRATDDPDIEGALSEALGRHVRLVSTPPPVPRIEEIWDPAKGPHKYGPVVGEVDAQEVIDVRASLAAPGGFFDAAPLHYLTTATLKELSRREPRSVFDARRFRPNLLLDVEEEEGFVENEWTVVRIGEVELRTLMPVPRCVMTTLAQDDLPRDANVLRSTARHNMIDAGPLGPLPCAGIYAAVVAEGMVSVGDEVEVVR